VQERRLGGVAVPVIGLGTWKMEHDDRTRAIAAIRRAVDVGMTHIDTAELYGSGRVESLVGEALAGIRDRVVLVSKVLPRNASYEGTLRACEQSLRRLRTDHLDCYLLHWREQLPLEDTFRAIEQLVADGKIRAWGVSNFDHDDLDEALGIVGRGKIACNQVLYHLLERTIEHRVIPWCEAHGVTVVAYSPFGSGAFPKRPVLDSIAKQYGATPRQIALAYLTRRESVIAIPKSANVVHVEELAHPVALTANAIAELDAAFPRGAWQGLPMI